MDQPNDTPATASRKRPYSRAAHRARSHESAHLEEPPLSDDSHLLPDHPLVARGAAEMVGSDAELESLIRHLRSAGSFAYDTEFIGELTYFPKLCLIQTASAEKVALIDPLAKIDLRPFWELLCNASVEKIVHAGQQDIEPVIRHLGRSPANVFDTQIAAGFVAPPLSRVPFQAGDGTDRREIGEGPDLYALGSAAAVGGATALRGRRCALSAADASRAAKTTGGKRARRVCGGGVRGAMQYVALPL